MIQSRRRFLRAGLAGTVLSGTAEGQDPNVNPRFSTIEYLRHYYRESRAALAVPERAESLPEWRDRVAGRLKRVLGLEACQAASLNPRTTALGPRPGDYRVERVVFSSEPYADVPGLLLIPERSSRTPVPAVLCLHGNVPGAKNEITGETSDPKAREGLALYGDDYARELARRGFITFAIDLRDSGERGHREPYRGVPVMPREGDLETENWRQVASLMAIPAGRTYLGLCVFDAIRALDYLSSRSEVASEAIGCVGFSAGATLGAWLAVLDRRVKVLGVSGTSAGSRQSSADSMHLRRPAGLLPGFYLDLDEDVCLAAVAPTPMVFARDWRQENPRRDPDVPSIRRAYNGMNAGSNLELKYGERPGHVWHGETVLPWFTERLRTLGVR